MNKPAYCFTTFMVITVIVTLVLPGVISCRHEPDDDLNSKKYLTGPIVIDGRKDAAWDGGAAAKAAGNAVTPAGNDLAALYVTNYADNLYVALELDLSDFWVNDRIALIIDKDGDTSGYPDGMSIDGWQKAADTMTFTNGKAYIYFFHNPTQTNTGASVLHVGGSVPETGADWEGNPAKVTASSYHWDNPGYPPFLEYSFALSDLDIARDDVIRVFAVISNRWKDDTTHATDIVPEIAPPDNQDVTFDFDSALSCTIQ